MTTLSSPTAAPRARPAADRAMRWLLRVDQGRGGSRSDLHQAFSTSILVSAARCLLTYVILPFVAPALGWAAGVGPWIGLPLGTVAIVSNVVSMRRFWVADHRWRWVYTVVGTSVIVLVLVLMAGDVADLVG